MPYVRRRRQVRRRFGRRPVGARRAGFRRRVTRATAPKVTRDIGCLTVLNKHHTKPIRVVETERDAGLIQAANDANWAMLYTFDPSGTSSNSSGFRYSNTTNYAGMDNWTSYATLYDYYKVREIRIRCWVATSGVNLLNNNMEIYWRHDYDDTSTPTAITWINDYENVKHFRFTAENPEVTIVLKYPKVQYVTTAIAQTTLALSGHVPKKMPWTDCTQPVTIWGMRFFLPATVASLDLHMDVTYDVLFKNKQ